MLIDQSKLFVVVSVLLTLTLSANSQDFPQFRGQGGRGVVSEIKLGDGFSVENNLRWKKELPGSGWSQPIIFGDRVYVTTAEAENDLRPKDFAGGVRMPQSMGMGGGKAPDFEITWKVICLDIETGKTIWETSIESAKPKFPIHPSNSYATETPAVNSTGVYAYFGAIGKVVGLSKEGKLKWSRDVGAFKTGNDFGTGSSLSIGQDRVFVQNLSEESGDIWCFNTSNGETIWRQKREGARTSWSTPVLWKNPKRSELIVSGGERIDSYQPESGELLWSLSKVKAATACSVCVDGNQIYFGGSDPMSKGPLFAVAAGGSGEIAPKRTNQEFENCAWRQPRSAPGMASPVSNGEFVYVVDRSILRCHDAKTGEKVYENRLPNMKLIVSCPMIVGDDLILVDEAGTVGTIQVGREFKFRSAGKLNDTVWSSPAAAHGAVFIRGVDGLYCINAK